MEEEKIIDAPLTAVEDATPPESPIVEDAGPDAKENSDDDLTEEVKETIDYERLAAEDLARIKRLDPSFAAASHLSELPFARRYAQLRDLGLSVTEALAAAYPRFERADGRRHLRAIAPRGSRTPEDGLSRDGMKEAKSLFAGLSETEINALYRRVCNKRDI